MAKLHYKRGIPMLRIGKMTDYAMLIMSQMAKTPDSILSATALADALHLTAPTVSKILKMLSEANLVNSIRGAEGGYLLSKPAIEISVADIIAAMEGDLALTECCEASGLCVIDSNCTMRANWKKINKMVYIMLSKLTIVDMLKPLSEGLFDGK
jgi:FeS assembly SUF system regulator